MVWYAACYGHTRAKGDRAPYPGDAALALMQAILICLWWLADVNKTLTLLTFNRSKALGTSIDVAAAEQTTAELNSRLKEGVASISKSCSADIVVEWMAHAVCTTLRGNHVTTLCCPAIACMTFLLYNLSAAALEATAYICAEHAELHAECASKVTSLRQ